MIWTDAICLESLRNAYDDPFINCDMDEEPEAIGQCQYCRGEIHEDDDHYVINDNLVHYDEHGDCLRDFVTEEYSISIGGEWWFVFTHNEKDYCIKEEKGVAKKLMDIFADCLN